MKLFESNIAIIGAGPGGIACSLFLEKYGIDHLIFDKASFPRDKICGDAFSGKVVDTLNKIDNQLLPEIMQFPSQADSWGVIFIAPNRKELRVPFKPDYDRSSDRIPGFISKRIDFDNWFAEKLKAKISSRFKENIGFNNFEKNENGWLCSDSEGANELRSKLLIVADGAQSQFAKKVGGIQKENKHYAAGIRMYYSGVKDLDPENFIELHFLKDFIPGYLWIFPLPNGLANVGVGLRSDVVGKKKINLIQMLQDMIESDDILKKRFKNAKIEDGAKGFGLPLGSKQRSISGDGYVLLGDAASLIDPFTGEGIGNAMISGMIAAKTISEATDYSAWNMKNYDHAVYRRLGEELKISSQLQRLAGQAWLFNLVVNKATTNKALSELISCMFLDVELRNKLKDPKFYFKLMFN